MGWTAATLLSRLLAVPTLQSIRGHEVSALPIQYELPEFPVMYLLSIDQMK